jgi:imidazolonepropionase-like amidohydrolase
MRSLVVVVALLLAALPLQAKVVAITNVNVVSMIDSRVDLDQTVILRDALIERVGPASSTEVPAGATTFDGRGRWLMPGLVDSHVHLRSVDLDAYLAWGVTTVRDLAGIASVLDLKRRIDRGELLGPHVIAATMLINGPNPRSSAAQFATVISNASQAESIVTTQLARGCEVVKLYENLTLAMYDALVASAHAHGAKVTGHISVFVDIHHAIESQDSIEHLSGYERAVTLLTNANGADIGAWQFVDRSRYAALAELSATKGVWNCPTLYVYAVLSNFDSQIIANRRAFIGEMHAHGAKLLAGTDAGYLLPAGSSLFEELRELVASGLTPYEALRTATSDAAQFYGRDIGTIAAGKRADLLLLGSNPLESIDALDDRRLVILEGRPLTAPHRRVARH